MAQLREQLKTKKASKRPDLSKQKPPAEKMRLTPEERDRINVDFFEAVKEGKKADIERLLKKGADMEARDEEGRTALMIAARNGRTDICAMLLAKGADIESGGVYYGWTPLMWAAWGKNTETCAFLIEKGANVNATNKYGRNALMIIAKSGDEYTKTCKLLVKKGINLSAKDEAGWTALMYAEAGSEKETAEFLKLHMIKKIMGERAETFLSSLKECIKA
jgi:ankyrin repeat protein